MLFLNVMVSDYKKKPSDDCSKLQLESIVESKFQHSNHFLSQSETIKEEAQKAERLSVLEEKIRELVIEYYSAMNSGE